MGAVAVGRGFGGFAGAPPVGLAGGKLDVRHLARGLQRHFVEKEKSRLMAVADKLTEIGGQHDMEFCINSTDPPASANGGQGWVNIPLTAQVFGSDDLLAFALAHEKGHINNGDYRAADKRSCDRDPGGAGVGVHRPQTAGRPHTR